MDEVPGPPRAGGERTSQLAWLRTRWAIERTLGAWMRTAVSLIGFGFTIFQFFRRMDQMPGLEHARRPGLSDSLSLALVAAGTLGLIVALIEYRGTLHYLWSPDFRDLAGPRDRPGWTPTSVTSMVLCLIGICALLMMI